MWGVKRMEKTLTQIIDEVCDEICIHYCEYRNTTDEDGICEKVRNENTCPLDKLRWKWWHVKNADITTSAWKGQGNTLVRTLREYP